MARYCPECGRENVDAGKFCTECGSRLESSAAAGAAVTQVLDNRYEILATVKSGAMGCIYKAKDTRLENIVAVKQMLSSFASPHDARYAEARFKEEARMLSTLHHSGLPKVIDYFTVKEPSCGTTQHYLVMTFIEGKDLETIIHERNRKPFSVDEALGYSRQIVEILSYLHARNPSVVYRDLNPRNIMVQSGKVFLVDFGIARLFTPQQKGTAIGTPGYAAPEQYKGAAEPRSDIFSLGAVLHYLLTGMDPEDSSDSGLFSFVRPGSINPAIPEYLDALIMSMVDIVVDRRPHSTEEVMKALDGRRHESALLSVELKKPHSSAAEEHLNKGVKHLDEGDYDRAIGEFSKAIELRPGYAIQYNNRGNAHFFKDDYDRAIADYCRAIEKKPDYANAFFNRGNAYYSKGDWDKAIDDFGRAMELQPDFGEACSNRGNAYSKKGDYDTAIDEYSRAIAIRHDDANAYSNRGNAYYFKGRFDKAIADYDKAIELKPDYANAYFNRGNAYYHRQEYEKSWEDICRAESLGCEIDQRFLDDLKKALDRCM